LSVEKSDVEPLLFRSDVAGKLIAHRECTLAEEFQTGVVLA
jgi:hypothetical protein